MTSRYVATATDERPVSRLNRLPMRPPVPRRPADITK